MLQKRLDCYKRATIILVVLLVLTLTALFAIGAFSLTLAQDFQDLKNETETQTTEFKETISSLETEIQAKDKEIEELSTTASELQNELNRVDTIAETTGLPKEVALSLYNGAINSGIDLPIVLAMVQTESSFQTDLVHHNSNGTIDIGIMQINSCHADMWRAMYGEPYNTANVIDVDKNIKLGLKLLGGHLDNNGWDMTAALTAYNRGQGGMERLRRNTGSAESSYSRLIYQRAEYWRSVIS